MSEEEARKSGFFFVEFSGLVGNFTELVKKDGLVELERWVTGRLSPREFLIVCILLDATNNILDRESACVAESKGSWYHF